MAYRIEFKPAARREFDALAREVQSRLQPRIEALAADPRPPGARKLQGKPHRYRIRVGDYRILYDVEDAVILVLVLRIGHRSTVYRRADTL